MGNQNGQVTDDVTWL